MKLQVTQENLNKAIGSVARVANSRSTLPILSNILLKTVDGRLSVSATNLDVGITHVIGSKISKEGSITIPAKLTQDFVNNLPPGVIDLELEDSKLHISLGDYKSTINGILAEDFPVMPDIGDAKHLKVKASILKKSLQKAVFAASSDETRPVLTGLLIQGFEGDLFIVATDSYRLAESKAVKYKEDIDLVIPSNVIHDLLRVMDEDNDVIDIAHNNQQVSIAIGDIEIVSRLIDGKYPPYKALIPSQFEHEAVIDRKEFVNITKISALFAREAAGSITLKTDEANGRMSIDSVASQLGQNTSAAAAKIKGDGEITLNSRYLLDALGAFDGKDVKFAFNGKIDPIMITDPADKSYKHIIMPLKA